MKRGIKPSILLSAAGVTLVTRLVAAQDPDPTAAADKDPVAAVAAPAAAEAPPAEEPAPKSAAAAGTEPPPVAPDRLPDAGYVPGYRSYVGLGTSPNVPRVAALPGGVTPSFSAPVPADSWAFTFSGFLSASLRASVGSRPDPAEGQSKTVYHSPPKTVDVYGSFLSANADPGSWVGLRFQFGNKYVSALASIDTYNPSRASTYTQIGSQYFINDSFLAFRAPALGKLRLSWNVGYFSNIYYGNLGQYGGGLYGQPIFGNPRGAGETIFGEYDLSKDLTLIVEDGIGSNLKTGKAPTGTLNSASSNYADSSLPATWTHHAHLSIQRSGDITVRAGVHFMSYFTLSDEVAPLPTDNPDTPQWDESNPRDGHINITGLDVRAISQTYGYLAGAVAHIDARNSYRVRGLRTYAEDGASLSNDWLGPSAQGNGSVFVAALNYRFSVASMLRAPKPFFGDGPDLQIETAFHFAHVSSDDPVYGGRSKHKYGVDALYTLLPWFGVGFRADRIAPNSHDSQESFSVIAPRIQFRSGWQSHEVVTLKYVKWFYGAHSRGDGYQMLSRNQLDDQLIALNVSMWW